MLVCTVLVTVFNANNVTTKKVYLSLRKNQPRLNQNKPEIKVDL